MQLLINKAITEYKKEMINDNTNTDSIFFIIDELGSELNDEQFETFSQTVYSTLKHQINRCF